MANRIQLRRDGAQQWANVNPVLAQAELGIEIDTGRIKIGDGVTSWNQLKYERPIESESNTANTLVKRDADGGFQAGAITGSLIGNAATATRLSNARQITLTGDLVGSSSFDGSSNLNLIAQLSFVPALPHYDPLNLNATGTYTKVTVDSQGRVKGASNPTTILGYGITDAQPLDSDLTSFAAISTPGIITRVSEGNIVTRSITVVDSGRLVVANGNAVSANPSLDLAETGVASATPTYFGSGAVQKLFNVPTIASATQTLNASKIGVDVWGRIYSITDIPIATSVEGTTASAWSTSTSYSRYVKVTNAGRLYQALNTGTAGATAPTHTTGDASDGTVSWRHLGLVTTRQKGLASFDQEDFDVDSNGHVEIATAGVDNTQLQNNQIRFADGNSYTAYELDNELTSSTGYRGITTINNLSVNTTGGSPLLKCLAADDNLDINTSASTIFSDITLDKTSTAIQTINRAGSLTLLMDANTSVNRFLRLTATNVGAGDARIEVSAENSVSIDSINSTLALTAGQQISIISTADVRVEDFYFANNVLSSTNSTIVLDPAGIGDNTGVVQIKGDLQVDGTTVTVNSTTMTVDDPIISLGGDTAPTTDDNKDRGVEFRYYDTQARLGFYGWDDSYTTLAGTTGGYRFLYNAANTSEVFTGTDAGIIAGNLALTTNTGSSSTTTGTLVVTGGTGISQNLWVGGTANVAGAVTFQSTLSVTDNVTLNKNVTIIGSDTAATELFKIKNGSSVDKFTVDSSSGNTSILGTLGVTGATTLTGNLTTQSASIVNIQNTTNSNVSGAIAGTAYASLVTYGALKVDGGASVAQGLIVGGDLKIYGQFDVDGAVSYSGNTIFKGNVSIDNDGVTPYKFNLTSSTGRLDTIGQIVTTNATDSTTTGTGALIVTGGAGIGAQLRVGGNTTITGATQINNTLGVSLATTLSSTLDVTGNTTLNSNVTIIGSDTAATELFKIKNGSSVDKFVVDSSSGNTTVSGTLGVTGVTTLSSTLGVTGDTTLAGDLAVNGGDLTTTATTATLFNTTATTLNIGQAATTLSIGSTTGTLTIRNASTVITGNLTVNGTTTTVSSTVLTVADKNIELGTTGTPTNITADGGGLTLKGTTDKLITWDSTNANWTSSEHWNLATNKDLKIANTSVINSSRQLVNITGLTMPGSYDITVNTNKFIVSGASGNTTIAGTLGVTGVTTLSSTLGVTGGATFSNTVGITGDLSVNSNKFVVTASSGNTSIAGTLGVTGVTTLSSTLGVTGNTTLSGTLGVTLGTTLSSTLGVTGLATLSGGLTISGNTTTATEYFRITDGAGTPLTKFLVDSATGNTTIAGTLGVTGVTTLSSDLGVTGATTLTSLTCSSNATFSNTVNLNATVNSSSSGSVNLNGNTALGTTTSNTLQVASTSTFNGPVSLTNTLSSSSSVTMTGGSLLIKNASSIDKFVFNPATSSATITGTLGVTGNTTVGGTLIVTGVTTLNSNLGVTGTTTLSSTLGVTGDLSVNTNKFVVTASSGNTTVAGTLGVTGITTLSSVLNANGGITVDTNAFTVDDITGNTNIAGTLNVTGITTLSSVLNANGGITGALTGNATTATTLQNSRTIGISGDGTGTATSFNGASNITIPFTLTNSGITAGTYTKITVDAKGRATIGAAATTSDIGEGTNLYYTQGRFDTAFGGKTTTNLTEGTNLYYTQGRFDTAFTAKSTTNLTEGTNLYYTDERSQDAAAAALVTNATHSGVSVTYNDAGNAINISRNTLTYSNVTASGNSSTTAFTAQTGRSVNNLLVIVGGLISTPTIDYTYSDQVILSGVVGHRGENTVVVSSVSGLTVGQPVSGSGIASSATITSITGTTLTLSANNLTFLRRAEINTVSSISGFGIPSAANQTYTGVASTSNGSGTGATFNVSRDSAGAISGVTINNGGTNYATSEIITLSGLLVGGSSSAENITATISSVNTVTTTATFTPIVKFTTAPATGTNNISIRYLPL